MYKKRIDRMAKKISAAIVLEGEKAYRSALQSINTAQKELRSEMKLAESTYKGQQNSLDALQKKQKLIADQLELVTKKEKAHGDAIKYQQAEQAKAEASMEKYRQQLGAAQRSLEDMQRSGQYSNEELSRQQNLINLIQGDLTKAERAYNTASNKISEYGARQNEAKTEINKLNEEQRKTAQYVREAERSFDGAAVSIDEYGRETEEASKNTLELGNMIKAQIGSAAIIAVAKKLVGAIKEISEAAIEVGSQFEASMSQVAATMAISQTSAEYDQLANAAKAAGQTTIYSASQAAEALNYLALAGYDANKAVQTLPKVLDLAAAGGMELGYASDLVTDSMAALGLETSELDGYIDQMARTAQRSNTSVAQLGEATLVAAGAVSTANMDVIDMNVALGILANNGIKGAEGGTHLRNVLLSLSAPTGNAAKALNKLGIETIDANGNLRSLNDIMIDFNRALDGMGSAEKAGYISAIFNKRDISAVNALLKGTGEEYRNLRRELENASGAASEMAATMNDNLKGKVTILKSALEGLGITAYEVFDDDLKRGVDEATSSINKLQHAIEHGDLGVSLAKMSDSLGDFIDRAVEFGSGALPVVINMLSFLMDHAGGIATGITTAVAAWKAYQLSVRLAAAEQMSLNAVMAANPIGAVITGVVALTVAVTTFSSYAKEMQDSMGEGARASMELADAARMVNEAYADNASARAASMQEREAEERVVKSLVGELRELNKQEELSASDKARLQAAAQELNGVLGDVVFTIDKETGRLTENSAAMLDNAEAMYKMQVAAAAQEDLARIADERYQAEKKLLEIESQIEEQQQRAATSAEAYAAAQADMIKNGQTQAEVYTTIGYGADTEASALAALKEQQEELTATMQAADEEYANTIAYIDETTAAYNEMIGGVSESSSAIDDTTSAILTAFESLTEAEQQLLEDTAKTFSEFDGIFEEMSMSTEMSLEKMAENLENNAAMFAQHADNIKAATDDARYGVDAGYTAIVDKFIAMGAEGVPYLNAFVTGSEEQIARLTEAFSAFEDTQAEVDFTLYTEWLAKEQEQGAQLQENVALTMAAQIDEYDAAHATMQENLQTHNDTMSELATTGVTDMATAITEGTPQVETASEGLGDAAVSGAGSALGVYREGGQSAVMYQMGQGADDSLAQGIIDNQDVVRSAMQTSIDNAIDNISFARLTSRVNQALGEAMS